MSNSVDPNWIPYRVVLREESGAPLQQVFECMAADDAHAVEQAGRACPGCEIVSCLPFDDSPLAYVIYSSNESAMSDSAGFWNSDSGWTTFARATRFSYAETQTLSLPVSTGEDAAWVLWREADASYGVFSMDTADVRLTLDVTYVLNEESAMGMAELLRRMCRRAIGDGMLTGETGAEVDEYSLDVVMLPEPLSEDELASFMRQRIVNGDWALDDIPVRMARYGLMEPYAFVDEMRERMESAKGASAA